MNCKFATIDGRKCLVNFKTNDGRVAMVVQKMCEDAEVIEIKQVQISDLDSGTLIINNSICLQMEICEAVLVYTRFNLIRYHQVLPIPSQPADA